MSGKSKPQSGCLRMVRGVPLESPKTHQFAPRPPRRQALNIFVPQPGSPLRFLQSGQKIGQGCSGKRFPRAPRAGSPGPWIAKLELINVGWLVGALPPHPRTVDLKVSPVLRLRIAGGKYQLKNGDPENPENPSGRNPENPSGRNPGNPSGRNPGNRKNINQQVLIN